jgi:hypothetical protein
MGLFINPSFSELIVGKVGIQKVEDGKQKTCSQKADKFFTVINVLRPLSITCIAYYICSAPPWE